MSRTLSVRPWLKSLRLSWSSGTPPLPAGVVGVPSAARRPIVSKGERETGKATVALMTFAQRRPSRTGRLPWCFDRVRVWSGGRKCLRLLLPVAGLSHSEQGNDRVG